MRYFKPLPFLLSFILSLGLVLTCSANSKIHERTLPNGLKVIVKEDHRAPVVVSQIWYKVGSAFEPGGYTGLSHVLEHMMFKGTKKYKPGEFSKIIAENGGQENAFTSYDFTGYFQKLEAKRLAISFKLEADRMHNLNLLAKEFAKEVQVVKEERRMRTEDNPQALTYERFLAAAHIVSPYHHPVIGWMDDLNNLKLNDIRSWYKTWYAPNNATLIVVGNVHPQRVFNLAKKYFAKFPKSTLPPIKPQRAQRGLGERSIVVNAPAKLPILLMGYNVPSLKTANPKWKAYALEVLGGILDGGNSARIPKNIIRGEHIAIEAGAGYSPHRRFDTLFMFEGIPSPTHTLKDLQRAFLNQVKQLQKTLVSERELARIKAQVVADKVFSKDSLYGQAMEIGQLESISMSWRDGEDYVKQIQTVTPKQVQQVAKEYLIPQRLTTAILKPLPTSTKKAPVKEEAEEQTDKRTQS